jgi:hypothetical protein
VATLLDQLEDAGERLLGDIVLGPDPRPRWTRRRRSERIDLHHRAGHAQGGRARSRCGKSGEGQPWSARASHRLNFGGGRSS